MMEVIPEKVELTKLEKEYDTVMQQIAILQQENMNMRNRINELEGLESDNIIEANSEENIGIADLSENNMKFQSDTEKSGL